MAKCRFVQPDLVRLPLSENDFIDVKKELNAGEQRRVFSALMHPLSIGEKPTLDPQLVGKTKLVAYLVGWSFVDADGKPVPLSESAIDNLDVDTYAELVKAVDDHEAALEAAREAKKKTSSGESSSSPTSPSADL